MTTTDTAVRGGKGSNQFQTKGVSAGESDRSRAGVGRSLAQSLQSEAWDAARGRQLLEEAQRLSVDIQSAVTARANSIANGAVQLAQADSRPRGLSRFRSKKGRDDVIDLRDLALPTEPVPEGDRETLRYLSSNELDARVAHNLAEMRRIQESNGVQAWDEDDGSWRFRDADEYPTPESHLDTRRRLTRLHSDSMACLDEVSVRCSTAPVA